MKKLFLFTVMILIVLLSVPLGFAETNLLSEQHGIINHYVILETDNPSVALNLYGVETERVTNFKIEEQKTRVENFVKYSNVEITCKVEPKADLNGFKPKCFELKQETIPNTIKYFEEINTSKQIENLTLLEKTEKIISNYKNTTTKTVLTTSDLQITSGLKTIKISWKTPISKEIWGSSGFWFINPANWWDTDYEARRPLNIGVAHSEIDTNYTHTITGINSTTWNCADSNSIAVVYQKSGTETELDAVIQGVCGVSTDMNILFRAQTNILADTGMTSIDTNGYYAYVNDENVATPMRDCDEVYLVCEDFEALNDGDLAGQNGWTGDVTIDVISSDVNCSGGGKCAKGIGDGSNDEVIKSLGTGARILKGFMSNSLKQTAGAYVYVSINNGITQEIRLPYLRGYGAVDMGIYEPTNRSTVTFTENTPNDFWRSFESNFDTEDVNCTIMDGTSAGETISDDNATWTGIDNVGLNMLDTTVVGEFVYWDDIIIYKVLDITPSYTIGTVEKLSRARFTVTGSTVLDPDEGVTSVLRTLTNISDYNALLDIPTFSWLENSVQFSTDTNTTRSFTVAGDYNISLIMDWNSAFYQEDKTVTISQLAQNVDLNYSTNNFTTANADVNFGVTYDGNVTAFNWGFPQDGNVTTQNANKTYTSSGLKQVCLTTTTGGVANRTTCENFYVGRVIVKIPKDAESFVALSPFNMSASAYPNQSYSALAVDSNIFVFNDTTNFDSTITVDFNADYFDTGKTFTFNSYLYTYHPYLIADDGDNLEATIFTINNPKGRITVSGITIESYTDINEVSTLVESKVSDGTGQAILHFIQGQEYTLIFYDSSDNVLLTETIEANNTSYFAYLELGDVVLTPDIVGIVGVDWHPTIGNILPIDQNVSFWQLLRPQNITIGDVNIWITSITDTNIVFNQVFSVNSAVDYNLSYDLNVAGYSTNYPLKINMVIKDSDGTKLGLTRTKSYSFKNTGFILATERAKDALGQFGVTLLSLIITVILISFLTARGIGEDMNFVVVPAMFITGMFVLIGWITFDIWASGVMFGIGMALWGVRK